MRSVALFLSLSSLSAISGAIALAGCSSSQPSAVQSFAQDYCAYFMPCCGGGGDAGAPDPGTCEAAIVSSSQSSGFDPSLTAACLTAMKQAASTTDFCTTLGAAAAPCDAVFASVPSSGTIQPGGTCTNSSQCASAPDGIAVCAALPSTPPAPTGTCKQILRGLAGDAPCSSEQYAGVVTSEGAGPLPNVSYTCHDFDGMFCDFATSTCEPFLAIGQACDQTGDDCGPYATCQTTGYGADGGITTACTADLAAGTACEPIGAALLVCDPRTTRCLAATGTCTAFLPSGSACTTDDQCEGSCVAGKCATALQADLCPP